MTCIVVAVVGFLHAGFWGARIVVGTAPQDLAALVVATAGGLGEHAAFAFGIQGDVATSVVFPVLAATIAAGAVGDAVVGVIAVGGGDTTYRAGLAVACSVIGNAHLAIGGDCAGNTVGRIVDADVVDTDTTTAAGDTGAVADGVVLHALGDASDGVAKAGQATEFVVLVAYVAVVCLAFSIELAVDFFLYALAVDVVGVVGLGAGGAVNNLDEVTCLIVALANVLFVSAGLQCLASLLVVGVDGGAACLVNTAGHATKAVVLVGGAFAIAVDFSNEVAVAVVAAVGGHRLWLGLVNAGFPISDAGDATVLVVGGLAAVAAGAAGVASVMLGDALAPGVEFELGLALLQETVALVVAQVGVVDIAVNGVDGAAKGVMLVLLDEAGSIGGLVYLATEVVMTVVGVAVFIGSGDQTVLGIVMEALGVTQGIGLAGQAACFVIAGGAEVASSVGVAVDVACVVVGLAGDAALGALADAAIADGGGGKDVAVAGVLATKEVVVGIAGGDGIAAFGDGDVGFDCMALGIDTKVAPDVVVAAAANQGIHGIVAIVTEVACHARDDVLFAAGLAGGAGGNDHGVHEFCCRANIEAAAIVAAIAHDETIEGGTGFGGQHGF
ncbi:hypothetical protein ACO0LC_29030, partial [Undibacterium sp. JH2W]|uniref:hypothetical protein n=1 Tax=Undibacterium sp. JH2W TaxID=3413037 RepID=UPI003BF047F2